MKSRFNMAGDDQVTPADDQVTSADDQVTPADDELTPADDEMPTRDDPLSSAADHDRTVPEDDQVTPAADSYPRSPGDQEVPAVEEEHMLPDDDQVVLVVEDDQALVEDNQALAEDDQGAPAYAADDRVPDAAAGSPAAASTGESSDGRWHEIQAMFVDDPRASVEQAAAVVNDSVETFVSSVKDRQNSLHSAWQRNDADTEQLRTALQQYRDFSRSIDDFSRQS